MSLAIAMIVAYTPFFYWVIVDWRQQVKESKKTH